jgi:hypothetical protein
MKNYFLYILLFVFTFSYCQNFGEPYTCGFQDANSVMKDLIYKTECAKKIRPISAYYKYNNDTIIYKNNDSIDGFIIVCGFNMFFDASETKFCDYQKIIFDCNACYKKHVSQIIDNYNFRRISENEYLSNFYWHTKMTIDFNNSKNECLSITYNFYDLPKTKKQYKSTYRKLERSKSI